MTAGPYKWRASGDDTPGFAMMTGMVVQCRRKSHSPERDWFMHTFTAVVERCPDTGLYVGHVPGFPGAHSQGKTLDELRGNLEEVIAMLLEDGEPELEAEFAGLQTITIQ